jgi:hypothetical protein
MKAFEKWWDTEGSNYIKYEVISGLEEGCAEIGWKAALEWASNQCEHLDGMCVLDCGCFSTVQNKIDEELEDE